MGEAALLVQLEKNLVSLLKVGRRKAVFKGSFLQQPPGGDHQPAELTSPLGTVG